MGLKEQGSGVKSRVGGAGHTGGLMATIGGRKVEWEGGGSRDRVESRDRVGSREGKKGLGKERREVHEFHLPFPSPQVQLS